MWGNIYHPCTTLFNTFIDWFSLNTGKGHIWNTVYVDNQKTTCWSQFFPSTKLGLGLKLRSSGLAGTLTCGATSPSALGFLPIRFITDWHKHPIPRIHSQVTQWNNKWKYYRELKRIKTKHERNEVSVSHIYAAPLSVKEHSLTTEPRSQSASELCVQPGLPGCWKMSSTQRLPLCTSGSVLLTGDLAVTMPKPKATH